MMTNTQKSSNFKVSSDPFIVADPFFTAPTQAESGDYGNKTIGVTQSINLSAARCEHAHLVAKMIALGGQVLVIDPIKASECINACSPHAIDPQVDCNDLVFVRDPILPVTLPNGRHIIFILPMRHPGRLREADIFKAILQYSYDGEVIDLREDPRYAGFNMEGGDLKWDAKHNILLAGVGPRTNIEAVHQLVADIENYSQSPDKIHFIKSVIVKTKAQYTQLFYHFDTHTNCQGESGLITTQGVLDKPSARALRGLRANRRIARISPEVSLQTFATNHNSVNGVAIVSSEEEHALRLFRQRQQPATGLSMQQFMALGGSVHCATNIVAGGNYDDMLEKAGGMLIDGTDYVSQFGFDPDQIRKEFLTTSQKPFKRIYQPVLSC